MNNLFNPDNFFWRWFGKLSDIFVLSILWILCCLPVLTIAPSCIALYDTIAHCVHGVEEHPYKRFFRTLKAELLRGIGITVLWGVICCILIMGYNFLYHMGENSQFAAIYSNVYLVTMLVPVAVFGWLIPIESRFTNSFVSLHKNAAAFAIVHLPPTALNLALLAAAIVLIMFIPVLALLIPGLLVTFQSWFIEKIFKQYMPDTNQEDTNDDTAE